MLLVFIIICASSANAQQQMVNSIGMKLAFIPPGSFMMGSPPSEKGRNFDEVLHQVTITKGFYITITEITQGQWMSLMLKNPSAFKACGAQCPVEQISWHDCQVFIDKLNHKEKTDSYRLPTEAEWEYACRGESAAAFANGEISHEFCGPEPALILMGWYCGNSGSLTHPVAQKQANAFGLYDMHGNVNEWVLDSCKWRDQLTGRTGVFTDTYRDGVVDPLSQIGNRHIYRGGSWSQSAKASRSAKRSVFKPVVRRSYLGFRIVKMIQ
jgi:formylglycine-generating enzyme required for sulfatase activity